MKNNLFVILLVAFIFRIVLAVINTYWFTLPQGGADAIRFERQAYSMVLSNQLFWSFEDSGAKLYVYITALIYSLFGRIPILLSLMNICLSIGCISFIHKGVFLITNNYKLANRSGWFAALLPNFALLSSLNLREAPIYFFLSLSILCLIRYYKCKAIKHLVMFLLAGFAAFLFHSGVITLYFGFLTSLILFSKKRNFGEKLFVVFVAVSFLLFINLTGVGMSKFGGSFEGALESLEDGVTVDEDAGSNYPEWLRSKEGVSDILLFPIQVVAFFFAPLIPFMVRTVFHLIGILDALFFLYLFWMIFKNRFAIKQCRISKILFVIILFLAIPFSLGVPNFGTNIRHRAKVLPVILMVPIYDKREREIIVKK